MTRYLCEDLIGKIFERLPAKTLVRFRCLSKSWYSRIGSPHFKRRHYLRSSQQVIIRHWEIYSRDVRNVRVRRLDYHIRREVKDLHTLHPYDCFPLCHELGLFDMSTKQFPCHLSKVVNSCNGILCLFDYHEKRISLWNPSIRRKLTLPDHPSFRNHGEEQAVAVGLGFDPITDDYKIVRISYIKYKETVENSFVYSMKTHTWSLIPSPVIPFEYLKLQACFVNGVLHWIAELYSELIDHYILTFNISTHVFGKIMLPKPRWFSRKPTIINGCLAVVSCEIGGDCWIWVMKKYNDVASWYAHLKLRSNSDDGEIKNVMQLSTNGYFLINYYHWLELYNSITGVRSVLSDSRFNKVYMERCLESLELLDSGEHVS